MKLYLVRHTEIALPPGVCYGRLDVGLRADCDTDIARTLAAIPPVAAIYTSPLSRCLTLARSLAARDGIEATPDERLVELSFGEWEGQQWDALDRAHTERWASDYWNTAPPGGERAAQLHERVASVLSEITQSANSSVAIVSHGGPIRAALSICLDLEPRAWIDKAIGFGAVLTLERPPGASSWMLMP